MYLKGLQGIQGEKGMSGENPELQRVIPEIFSRLNKNADQIAFVDNRANAQVRVIETQRIQLQQLEKIIKHMIKRLHDLGIKL